MIKKPLGEWTLAELKEYCWTRGDECEEGDCACVNCPFGGDYCKVGVPPHEWDLSEQPRWAEQEIEDAKFIMRLLPNCTHILRDNIDTSAIILRGTGIIINTDIFPSLKPGEKVALREIAEYKRES